MIVYELRYRLQGAPTWASLTTVTPPTYTWITASLPGGAHEVQVQAVDTSDNAPSGWSATRTINVDHAVAPTSDGAIGLLVELKVGVGAWTSLFTNPIAGPKYTLDVSSYASGTMLKVRARRVNLRTSEMSGWGSERTINVLHPSPAPVVYTGALAPLRGISNTERTSILGRETKTFQRLEVQAAGGTWKDVGQLVGATSEGDDYLVSVGITHDLDGTIIGATFELLREVRGSDGVVRSLAPFIATSPHNTGGALIRHGAPARFSTATILASASLTSGAWATVWAGYLDDPDWAGDVITVPARSTSRRLQDATIMRPKSYGSDAGVPLADVIRQKMADAGVGDLTLAVEGAPDWFVRPVEQPEGGNVLDAISSDALAIGWMLQDRFINRTEQRLVLGEPLRETVAASLTPAISLGASQYTDVSTFKTDTDGVRNIIEVSYVRGDQGITRVIARDEASILLYGERPMRLAYDAVTNVSNEPAAAALAGYALIDLSQPAIDVTIRTAPGRVGLVAVVVAGLT